jgi:glycosyltransferase involved in cell wall biosynthesis
MKEIAYFIETASLFESTYTGISNVNFEIVKYFFQNFSANTNFFHLKNIIKPEIVDFIIKTKNGGNLHRMHLNGSLYKSDVNEAVNRCKKNGAITVGIFPRTKVLIYGENKVTYSAFFDYEAQVIYDLSTILMPEFHHGTTIKLHAESFSQDLKTNDLAICISESTKEDLVQYLGFPAEKALVSYVGCEHDLQNAAVYKNLMSRYSAEDFVLILGTVEPRKNTQLIIDFIAENPEILVKYKFVFLGKDGWGKTFHQMISGLVINNEQNHERIKHFGYVSEEEKYILLMTAKFMIYPSFYEGFGLPVLEAMSVGCPVLASFSSSIPEVGGDCVFYFDPFSLASFEQGFHLIDETIDKQRGKVVNDIIAQSKKFTWGNFNRKFVDRILYDLK